MRNIALIPLRGGSKGIPGKNLKSLNGKPLCWYVIAAAIESHAVDEVWVSSEDMEIINYVAETFPDVKIRERPLALATDTASSESVMIDLIDNARFNPDDNLALIQATSPLLTGGDLDAAFDQLSKSSRKSLVSGVCFKRFLWSTNGEAMNYDVFKRPRRQEFEGLFLENGAFYISTVATIRALGNRIDSPAELFYMNELSAIELDEPSDWELLEAILK